MLHRDMIVEVKNAFRHVLCKNSLTNAIPEKYLLALRDDHPRWVGPELASSLRSNIVKHKWKPRDAAERIARLYVEMFKIDWHRGPVGARVIKDISKMLHLAVVALIEPSRECEVDLFGANIAYELLFSFRKIMYPTNTPTNVSNVIWRFLSTLTLPIRNQSSRTTTHADNWVDLLVRHGLLQLSKSADNNWSGLHELLGVHPELMNTVITQVTYAERRCLCNESESDRMRLQLGMGARPANQIGAEFSFINDISFDELLPFQTPLEDTKHSLEEDGIGKEEGVVDAAAPAAPAAHAADFNIFETPTYKRKRTMAYDEEKDSGHESKQRLVSSLDARENWRRTDGTLYSYFKVTKTAFKPIASKLSSPDIDKEARTLDIFCRESPLTWHDGMLPYEESRYVFTPIAN